MATLSVAAGNAAVNAVVDLLDVGGAGKLVFATSGDVTVAACTFTTTPAAFTTAGSATNGVATANPITSDTNAAGGTIAKCRLQNNAAATVMAPTVSTSAAEVNISSLVIGAGDTVTVSSLTVGITVA